MVVLVVVVVVVVVQLASHTLPLSSSGSAGDGRLADWLVLVAVVAIDFAIAIGQWP